MDNVTQTNKIMDCLQFNQPTEEQVSCLNNIEAFLAKENTDDYRIIAGSAGTGKSSIMNAVVKYCNNTNIKVEMAAPTARAARILTYKTKNWATTLHSMLFNVANNPEDPAISFSTKNDGFMEYKIFIIDEASMVGSKLICNHEDELFVCNHIILDTIAKYCKSGNKKNKIIFVGDRFQLAPISETISNALYAQYLNEKYKWNGHEIFLTQVKRQEENSDILCAATAIRNCIKNEVIEMPIITIPTLANTFKAIPQYIKDLETYGPNYVTNIAHTNKQNDFFNKEVRKRRFGINSRPICKNDVLLIKRNWNRNENNLNNGDTVIVKEVFYNDIVVESEISYVPVKLRAKNSDNEEIIIEDYLVVDCVLYNTPCLGILKERTLYSSRYKKNKTYRDSKKIQDDRYLGAIRAVHGYSITCNAAQGGEWHKVFLNTFKLPNLRWAYTAITRASDTLIIY